jgi:microsomal dipeptidase-like Zn-dependent dipeptidase
MLIDGLQYCLWSRKIFEQMREAGMSAVHVTVAYHETFRKTVEHIVDWNRRFREHGDLILMGRQAEDIDRARASNRTAIFFGLQTPMPIEDDLGLIEVLHALGVRFMQLTYNNQSLLGTGWMEREDAGLTRMGREAVAEMNRLGMIIDMSHSAERTTLETIDASARSIAITHANPSSWRATGRNKSDAVLKALAARGGMLGLSLYPLHLKDGSECTLASFTEMAARLAELVGADHIGIGSDLCQDQPDRVVEWMRNGRWTFTSDRATFPKQPDWFRDNRDFPRLRAGFAARGFLEGEIDGILGDNWRRFWEVSFTPQQSAERG